MQHVNLYQAQFQPRRDPLSARNLVLAMLAVLLSLTALSLWMHARQQPLDERVAVLEAQRVSAQRTLDAAQAQLQAARERAKDDGRIASLQAELSAKQGVLDLLGGAEHGLRGFSLYLEGLAERVVDRLWLSAIRIDQAGQHLRLAGHALDPAQVPALIDALAGAEAYRGREFRTVELLRSEIDPRRIDFVLASGAGQGGAQ